MALYESEYTLFLKEMREADTEEILNIPRSFPFHPQTAFSRMIYPVPPSDSFAQTFPI